MPLRSNRFIINERDMTNIIDALTLAAIELRLRSFKAPVPSAEATLKADSDKYRDLAFALAEARSIGISAELA